MLLTALVELVELYTLREDDPPKFSIVRHGCRSSELRCNLSDNSEISAIFCTVVFGWIALISLHAPGSSL